MLICAAVAALAVDYSLAQWCVADRCPGFFRELFEVVEPFGNGLGVLVVVAMIYYLDPTRRWAVPRLLGCSLGAGLAANMVKMLIVRTRPHSFDFSGEVLASFGGWLPLTSADSAGQSFPSAHTATAVGLAVGLMWLYPHGRRTFVVLAALVACQRIESGAHYLSDVLCGAAVGCIVASAWLHFGLLPDWMDRLEFWLGRRPQELAAGPVRDVQSADDDEDRPAPLAA